jgi:dCTP deaminase
MVNRESDMTALPDHWITEMAAEHAMIEPFAKNGTRKGKISFGVSSYGYDFRLSGEFKIPSPKGPKWLDPKKIDSMRYADHSGKHCIIPANSYVLGRSLEYFRIPRDVLVVCQGKSTYARCGVIVNVTPLEPEWEGFITISLANVASVPVKVYAGEGIAQAVFLRAESDCDISYADRKGKYQAQKKIEVSRV